MRVVQLSVCALLGAGVARAVWAVNPILPTWEHLADGEPHVFEDPNHPGTRRLYLYGSHDTTGTSYCGPDQVVWSCPVGNPNDWRLDGMLFRNGHDTLFAPDVVETRDAAGKKTYWLYPNVMAEERRNLIACADRPTGPFTPCNWDPAKPNHGTGIPFADPGIFVDDDGRVYGYWGFIRSYGAELDPKTMCTVKPGTKVVEDLVSGRDQPGEFRFFEASSMRKIKDKYVLIYSRITVEGEFGLPASNYTLAYAYGDHPLGPFTYGGTIIDARGREMLPSGQTRVTAAPNGNTHGSLCELNGKWFVVFHRQTGLNEFARQAMAAPVTVDVTPGPGGKVVISEAELTSEGFETEGLDPFKTYPASIACHYTGPRPAEEHYPNFSYSGPYPVNGAMVHVTDGSVIGYKYFDWTKAKGRKALTLELTRHPADLNGTVAVWLDHPTASEGGMKLGETALASGDPTALKTETIPLGPVPEGRHALYLVFTAAAPDRSLGSLESFRVR